MNHLALEIIGEIILPPFGLAILSLIGILSMGRNPRLGKFLAITPIVLLFFLSLPVVPLVLNSSSSHYQYTSAPLPEAEVIVILGGGRRAYALEYGTAESPEPDTVSNITLVRLRYGAKLARELKRPMLLSGGNTQVGLRSGFRPEADLMKELMEKEYKLPVKWVENQSEDTRENAKYSAKILKNNGIKSIYLVTHARHMRRARMRFEQQGLRVVPMATVFPPPAKITFEDFIPSFWGLYANRSMLYDFLNRLR